MEHVDFDDLSEYNYYNEDRYEEYGSELEEENTREIEELENEIAENTTNVRHCNTTDDCYKIYRDTTIECVSLENKSQRQRHQPSYGICKNQGCRRNNDNCYQGELCIKNNCVPVSEVERN